MPLCSPSTPQPTLGLCCFSLRASFPVLELGRKGIAQPTGSLTSGFRSARRWMSRTTSHVPEGSFLFVYC